MKILPPVLLLLALVLNAGASLAAQQSFELEVPSGETLSVDDYSASSKNLLIWLPSERGFGDRLPPVFSRLAELGINVWAVLLHDSYILPTGKHSLENIDVNDLTPLLDQALKRGFEQVFILGANRSSKLALELAYRWQRAHAGSNLLHGLLLFSPHLTKSTTGLGVDADFIKISAYSNLPVYILQTEYSTKFARVAELANQLSKGGSAVFIHSLRGVLNGYYIRKNDELSNTDLRMMERLPAVLKQAIRLLQATPVASLDTSFQQQEAGASKKTAVAASTATEPALHRFRGLNKRIPLKLENLQGDQFDLRSYRGKVVLVNFWATWCAPCIEEMPSLSRLNNKMTDKPFKIVAVNIGESRKNIRKFLQRIPANFEILVDPDNKAVRVWKVYAYPSNFIVGKNGEIVLAYRGALQWDSPDVIKKLESLF